MNTFAVKLAIVIPAYKITYFDQALESFANQTCKDFTLYIGDDASPENLEEVVTKYKSKISIVYHKFNSNMGAKDLISHWARCVDLIQGEEWIWFFSDDDVVSNNCVEGFYEILTSLKNSNNIINKIFRFNLVISDKDLNPLQKYITPAIFSIEYFLKKQYIAQSLTNRAVEFIFSRRTFYEKNGFVNFPLAWGSDKATILKFAQPNGFITIPKGEVFWRFSEFNISGNSDHSLNELKTIALNKEKQWLFNFVLDYRRSIFFYKIVYRIMHNITIDQAFIILKDSGIKDHGLLFTIFLTGIFIKLKKLIRFSKIKQSISRSLSIR